MTPAPPPTWLTDAVHRAATTPGSFYSRFLPPAEGGKPSAVLMLFAPVGTPSGADACITAARCPSAHVPTADRSHAHEHLGRIVLTRRSRHMRSHPGQVSFPGGRVDPSDASVVDAALREGREEIGLDASSVTVLGALPALYIPVSASVVTPVVAWWHTPHPLCPHETEEVEEVRTVAVDHLVEPAHRRSVVHPSGRTGPAFMVDHWVVWGFTAGLLHRFLQLAAVSQPWDGEPSIDVPLEFGGAASEREGGVSEPPRRWEGVLP